MIARASWLGCLIISSKNEKLVCIIFSNINYGIEMRQGRSILFTSSCKHAW